MKTLIVCTLNHAPKQFAKGGSNDRKRNYIRRNNSRAIYSEWFKENCISYKGNATMRAYRVDKNQKTIVEELRQRGVTVFPTHMVGQGFPDIVCGYAKCNFMFEIKNPDMALSGRQLTAAEKIFHFEWRGSVDIIETSDQAWAIIQQRTKNM